MENEHTVKMSTKRRKVVLTIKEKLALIEKAEKGETIAQLANAYGIGNSTVRDIIKQKRKLEEFSRECYSDAGPSKRKSMKMSSYQNLDTTMLKWIKDKQAEGVSVNGPMCADQAKIFHAALGLSGNFNASSGWLTRFKQRHGIKDLMQLPVRIDSDADRKLEEVESDEFREYQCLDADMVKWIKEKQSEEVIVDGSMCEDQAKTFFAALELKGEFNALAGWLKRFKQQHGIRDQVIMPMVKSKSDTDSCEVRSGVDKFNEYQRLDAAMVKWIKEKHSGGVTVSGEMCADQAKKFHASLGLSLDFKALGRWINGFKQRHSIRNLIMKPVVKSKSITDFRRVKSGVDICDEFKEYERLDAVMLKWLKEKQSGGVPVNCDMCADQAKIFHAELGVNGDFKEASGWFNRFKQQHDISDLVMTPVVKIRTDADFRKLEEVESGIDPRLDAAMLKWIKEKQSEGVPVDGQMCEDQAKIFHAALRLNGDLKEILSGWLNKFKQQHGISEVIIMPMVKIEPDPDLEDDHLRLDEAMVQWIIKKQLEGVSIDGEMFTDQAKVFHAALCLNPNWNEFSGWLNRFKAAHGICDRLIKIESDPDFRDEFSEYLRAEDLQLDQIYNVDETELYWRSLPGCTPSAMDRVTILCCSNASGTHKMKVLMVGKAKQPKSSKGAIIKNLPIYYYNQKRASMDSRIFQDWFHTKWLPEVTNFLKTNGFIQKAVLVLDSESYHPNKSVLKSDDGLMVAKILPSNASSSVLPMEQGVISLLKQHYRYDLIKHLSGEGGDIVKLSQEMQLLDVIHGVAQAWNKIQPITLLQSWRKLLPNLEEDGFLDFVMPETKDIVSELREMIPNLNGFEGVDKKCIEEWLEHDSSNEGAADIVIQPQQQTENTVSKQNQPQEQDSEDECEELEAIINRVSHNTALNSVDALLDYIEQRDCEYGDVVTLRNIRTNIKMTLKDSYKQTKITEFFGKMSK